MKKVGQMLSPALGREEVMRAARAFKVLRDWPQIVGEAMAQRSFPDRFDRGTVWVAVEGSAWAQELRMQKDQIIQRLEEKAGERGLFLNLRFGVRPLPKEPIEPAVEKPKKTKKERPADEGQLSIKEIAEQRLKRWPDGGHSKK